MKWRNVRQRDTATEHNKDEPLLGQFDLDAEYISVERDSNSASPSSLGSRPIEVPVAGATTLCPGDLSRFSPLLPPAGAPPPHTGLNLLELEEACLEAMRDSDLGRLALWATVLQTSQAAGQSLLAWPPSSTPTEPFLLFLLSTLGGPPPSWRSAPTGGPPTAFETSFPIYPQLPPPSPPFSGPPPACLPHQGSEMDPADPVGSCHAGRFVVAANSLSPPTPTTESPKTITLQLLRSQVPVSVPGSPADPFDASASLPSSVKSRQTESWLPGGDEFWRQTGAFCRLRPEAPVSLSPSDLLGDVLRPRRWLPPTTGLLSNNTLDLQTATKAEVEKQALPTVRDGLHRLSEVDGLEKSRQESERSAFLPRQPKEMQKSAGIVTSGGHFWLESRPSTGTIDTNNSLYNPAKLEPGHEEAVARQMGLSRVH
ncbi:unnamed protein product [Protopolystoma xenopodis]|uniref:Uncharacterized protein n=1 Tax=Protopolystoma xenopodis TaxID=117903 RepID=A0A448XHR1_9PLAT|nr:unnamed protein product [Protopolystoma xenopodis]